MEALSYLCYSVGLYDFIQSKKYNYQNRLRHTDFLELLAEAGLRIFAEETLALHESQIKKLRLAPRFRPIPLSDVLIVRSRLISQLALHTAND